MTETVGKVSLDLSKYPGEDFYSEGASEDLLLELVKNNEPGDYNRIIAENAGWSTLYHLSDLRGNIADFLPISKSDKVLEVGAGCGAITGAISKKAGSVTCIELSKKRSMINAYRNRDKDNIAIKVGNFQDIEKDLEADYDYIMLIGVFEYAASYIQDEKPYERFLEILLSHLKKGGRLVIAIENKYGLKYFAGCREDHLGDFYAGIEGYAADSFVKTFSRDELLKLSRQSGCSVKEYYPFPDYKLPVTIYSEDRMPEVGELHTIAPNFDNTRIAAFDEGKAFDEIIEDGKFPFFSNSFLFVLQKGDADSKAGRVAIYSKHSNERSPEYAIRTDIEQDEAGKRFVVKYPLTERANEHIASLNKKYQLLLKQYEDSVFVPNTYRSLDNAAEFEYLDGDTLEKLIARLLLAGKSEEALAIIDRYVKAVRALADDGQKLRAANVDLIFSNIMPVSENVLKDKWTVVDYEWTFEKETEADYIIYRAFKYLVAEVPMAESLGLCRKYGISDEKISAYEKEELAMQQWIAGERLSLIGFHSIFGKDAYKVSDMMRQASRLERRDRVKVYIDLGAGFSEKDTCYYCANVINGNTISLSIPVPKGARALRLDPTDDACMIKYIKVPAVDMLVNGRSLGGGVVFYKDADPQIIFNNVGSSDTLDIEYKIDALDSDFAEAVGEAVYDGTARRNKADLFRKKSPYEKFTL